MCGARYTKSKIYIPSKSKGAHTLRSLTPYPTVHFSGGYANRRFNVIPHTPKGSGVSAGGMRAGSGSSVSPHATLPYFVRGMRVGVTNGNQIKNLLIDLYNVWSNKIFSIQVA